MKPVKISLMLILGMLPQVTLAWDSEIEELIRQKQAKIEQLEKCQGKTKGLKIAGLSMLGITAVGVGVNIGEASKIKQNERTINTKDAEIRSLKEEIEKKRREAEAEKERLRQDSLKRCGISCDESIVGKYVACVENEAFKLYKCTRKDEWESVDNAWVGFCHEKGLAPEGWVVFPEVKYYPIEGEVLYVKEDGYKIYSSLEVKYDLLRVPKDDFCYACESGKEYDEKEKQCVEKGTGNKTTKPVSKNYMPDCPAGAKKGDKCTVNPNASLAECMYLGKTDENDKAVLTCTAKECAENYVLRLNSAGKSNGRCDTKESAEDYCKKQGENCKPVYRSNPNTDVENGAYMYHKCDCGETTNTTTKNEQEEIAKTSEESKCKEILKEGASWDSKHARWESKYVKNRTMNDVFKDGSTSEGLKPGEWAVKYGAGEIRGKGIPSDTKGDHGQLGSPEEKFAEDARYCWCKITYNNVPECSNILTSSWFVGDWCIGLPCSCEEACALAMVENLEGMLRGLFGEKE